MIFQHRINLLAAPKKSQDVATSILPIIRQFFASRSEALYSPTAHVRKIDYVKAEVDNKRTSVEFIITIEATSIDFSDLFLKTFLKQDATYPFHIITHDYHGL